ncbi:MAG: GyrI-like domain-containing protein [Verrucomicrobia bacterium]|nr:GyrI-like domain-containing protein [Verrucomicrobiota bacterium]MBV8278465.1 GyrI-like domain-containing protein [Verrucomicrobiota bacterium]
MITAPKVVERSEQPYVAVKSVVTMAEIGVAAGKFLGEIFGWVTGHGLTPAGAPFFKYNVIDMEHGLEIEFGIPTASLVAGDDRVLAGVLPAGRYASLIHQGPYEQLYEANAALLDWIKEQGLEIEVQGSPEGDRFGCRLEIYLTDPGAEKDPDKWETEVAIRLI